MTTAAAADDADDSFPQNSSSAEGLDGDRRPGRPRGKMQHLMLIFPPKNCQFEVHCTAFTQRFLTYPVPILFTRFTFIRLNPLHLHCLTDCKMLINLPMTHSHLHVWLQSLTIKGCVRLCVCLCVCPVMLCHMTITLQQLI